jgi:hypothetical protein
MKGNTPNTNTMLISNFQISEKSKKNKHSINNTVDKTKLWNVFESEVINNNKPKEPLECLYRTIRNRETCEMCQFSLAFSDEGFLTCTNNKCGIIYKDMLDQSPEWRFYGGARQVAQARQAVAS